MLKSSFEKQQGVYIIAEAGVNHNGSLELAKQLIDVAANAGADAVKFQTFKAEEVVSVNAPKAAYQERLTGNNESQLDMVRKLELSEEDHRELMEYCKENDIDFLSTAFDLPSLELLHRRFNLPVFKVPSGEISNPVLLLHLAQTGKPIIMSTGMANLGDIEEALGVLAFGYSHSTEPPSREAFRRAYWSERGRELLSYNVTLLHCTTEYPAALDEVNLLAMQTLKAAFGLPVGYSDHTEGINVPIAAAALGARIIEKHFTIDRSLPGPDHKASLEPFELRLMVAGIREVERALGRPNKVVVPVEQGNRLIARKSLVARTAIAIGEPFTPDNLTVKRPGTGIPAIEYYEWLGQTADRPYAPDDLIQR